MIQQADCATIKKLDCSYLADLGFIQRELFRFLSGLGDGGDAAGSVPDVRIIQALNYLESRKVAGVVIQRPNES